MAVLGTFSSFTTARLGIYASQASLNVTGNNIANINTDGYTRQRMDLVSLNATGMPKYASTYAINIGYGVLCESVSQIRDPYLDIRFRDEQAKLGEEETRLDGLNQLNQILDEVGRGKVNKEGFGVIQLQLEDLFDSLEGLQQRIGTEEYDDLVRSKADTLASLIKDAANGMERIQDNEYSLLQESTTKVNTLLNKIRELNAQIRTQGIYGDKALELRDARNNAIDELSEYMKIEVTYSMEKIDQYSEVEKLTITIADSGNPPIELVNGIYGTQLQMPEKIAQPNPEYDPKAVTGMKYIGKDGKPTDIERLAAPKKNPAYDPKVDGSMPYLKADGTPTNNAAEADKEPNPAYDATDPKGMKYLDEKGQPTDDIALANKVYNNSGDRDEEPDQIDQNLYLYQLAPLVDEKGHYMKDKYGQEIKETVDLTDTTLSGRLQAIRELLTEEGEFCSENDLKFDPDAATKRGIPYYQKVLDNWANALAQAFNEANQLDPSIVYETEATFDYGTGTNPNPNPTDGCFVDAKGDHLLCNGQPITSLKDDGNGNKVPKEISDYTPAELEVLRQSAAKKEEYSFYDGGVLFSTSSDNNNPNGITAKNISVSRDWGNGSVRVLNTKRPNEKDKPQVQDPETGEWKDSHTSRNDNILHMLAMYDQDRDFYAQTTTPDSHAKLPIFKGTFEEMFTGISGKLADATNFSSAVYNSYAINSLNLDNSRSSVSGVDLNEEATNMMQFEKSYSAACRLLTTLDSMLDKLINGTAI